MRTSYAASYADVLCGVLCALYFGLAACLMRTSYAESYASYARQPMRHKTLHKIKFEEKSYAVLCGWWVLQAKVLCASYMFFYCFFIPLNIVYIHIYIYICIYILYSNDIRRA